MFPPEYGDWRASRTDDNICLLTMLIQVVEADSAPAKLLCESSRALISAVRNEHWSGSSRQQMTRRDFRHFPGANQANLLAFQGAKYFSGEINGHGSNRN